MHSLKKRFFSIFKCIFLFSIFPFSKSFALAQTRECYEAALNTVSILFKENFKIPQWSEEEKKDGVSLKRLKNILEETGFSVSAIRVEDCHTLVGMDCTYILHLKSNHYIVILPHNEYQYIQIDQDLIPVFISKQSLEETMSGAVLRIKFPGKLPIYPKLIYSMRAVYLEEINVHETKQFAIKITNISNKPCAIKNIASSCGCLLFEKPIKSISQNGEEQFQGNIARSEPGRYDIKVVLETEDPSFSIIQIPVYGDVIDQSKTSPSFLNFGYLSAGKSISRSVTIVSKNTFTGMLKTSIAFDKGKKSQKLKLELFLLKNTFESL